MKTFILINLLTSQMITVDAELRIHAKRIACEVAGHHKSDSLYWIVKKDYHKVEGFTMLSV